MKFDFMSNRFKFFTMSGLVIALSVLLLVGKGLNFGIDFRGGNIIHVRFDKATTENEIRSVFGKMDKMYFTSDQLIIQAVSGSEGKEYIIQYPSTIESAEATETHSRVLRQLKAGIPYSDDSLEVSNVGPTIGGEMKKQGIIAAFLCIVGILLYLAWRFEFQSATGAVLSIVHDFCITIGFLSLVGLEFDVSVLAGILTMLGYSVNDSIVVLDRIRENRKLLRGTPLPEVINDSINQTLGRTINTSVTTLFTLISLLLFGGISLYGFAATLTFGVVVGTYSSIFIASPVLLEMTMRKEPKKR
jgi:preprotein translocase subunit SecF